MVLFILIVMIHVSYKLKTAQMSHPIYEYQFMNICLVNTVLFILSLVICYPDSHDSGLIHRFTTYPLSRYCKLKTAQMNSPHNS